MEVERSWVRRWFAGQAGLPYLGVDWNHVGGLAERASSSLQERVERAARQPCVQAGGRTGEALRRKHSPSDTQSVAMSGWQLSLVAGLVAAAALPLQAALQPAVYADPHDVSDAPRVPLVDFYGSRALALSAVPLVVAAVVAVVVVQPSQPSVRAALMLAGVPVVVDAGRFVTVIVGFWIMPTAWLLVLASMVQSRH
jgi:hypothetical protein